MAMMDIQVPDIGDFDEVGVIELLVKAGDTVKAEQSLITVESDKASMEIPSSHAGVVKEPRVAGGRQGQARLGGAGGGSMPQAHRPGPLSPRSLQNGLQRCSATAESATSRWQSWSSPATQVAWSWCYRRADPRWKPPPGVCPAGPVWP